MSEINNVYLPNVPMRWDPISKSNVPTINIQPCESYGKVIALTTGSAAARGDKMQESINIIQNKISEIEFDDFIVMMGDPILCAAALAAARAHLGQSELRLLRWDRRNKEYELLEVVI